MAELEDQVPEWAQANREMIDDQLMLLDLQLAANRFVCGDELSVADITAGIAVDFMKPSRIPLSEDLANIRRWHGELSARPSWKA
jgi:glutathione S-transferase